MCVGIWMWTRVWVYYKDTSVATHVAHSLALSSYMSVVTGWNDKLSTPLEMKCIRMPKTVWVQGATADDNDSYNIKSAVMRLIDRWRR